MDKISFYQINLNKCEAAQANLMAELGHLKDNSFVCLMQEPHFYGLNPSLSATFQMPKLTHVSLALIWQYCAASVYISYIINAFTCKIHTPSISTSLRGIRFPFLLLPFSHPHSVIILI